MLGGKKEVKNVTNDLQVDELANFAVNEHNSRTNSLEKIIFQKVVSCKEQVVQGKMYYIVIEVEEASKPKQYEAKVWVKDWENFRKLEDFKPVASAQGVPMGVIRSCGPPPGLQTVPADDPIVKEAAEHAVKTLQQGSNSLASYELSEVVSAQAEVKGDNTIFDLLLKTKRGKKEEHFKSEVHRTVDGAWSVKHADLQ